MIIDAHAHIGYDHVFDEETNGEQLLEMYDKYGVDKAIVQPFISRSYVSENARYHDMVYDLCQEHPDRFYGMASINPHFTYEDYDKEAERCIKELGFVGIKITTLAHAVHPATKDGLHTFEIADALGVPLMVHTGAGIPFADPIALVPGLKAFPKLKVVIAHAGTDLFLRQAIYLASEFKNAYLEPSWISIYGFHGIIKQIPANRIMFSSDQRINVPMELTKYRCSAKNEKDLEQMLYKTVTEVYNLKY